MTGLLPSIKYKEDVRKYRKLFRFWDKDGSGAIDLNEFLSVLVSAMK
jgi:Ca2+-binding EF-hand superfamily protein